MTPAHITVFVSQKPSTETGINRPENVFLACVAEYRCYAGALIVGDMKMVTGAQGCLGYWQGRRHPNARRASAPDPAGLRSEGGEVMKHHRRLSNNT